MKSCWKGQEYKLVSTNLSAHSSPLRLLHPRKAGLPLTPRVPQRFSQAFPHANPHSGIPYLISSALDLKNS